MNWTGLIIVLAILAAPFVWAISIYNGLVALRNRFKNAFASQAFNDAVMSYNTRVESFPDNILAGMFQFNTAQLLQVTESAEERKAPKVSLS